MIRLIAAIDQRRGIAKSGRQPWHLPADEKYFQDQTHRFGGAVLMGRKTFDVIRHPLAGRTNYVLSHESIEIPGVVEVTDLPAFLESFEGDLWVIGGATVYEQTLRVADELYLTHIEADYDCDQFFPAYDKMFVLTDESMPFTEADTSYRYAVYQRRPQTT